ncbi:unnamed protein product, partial [Owenia fusiformis]
RPVIIVIENTFKMRLQRPTKNGLHLYMLLLIVVVLVWIPERVCLEDFQDQKELIEAGMEGSAEFFSFIGEGDFKSSMKALTTTFGPLMLSVGPFLSFVMNFIQGDSEELAFMKEMMKKIENRFDKVDARFDDIERMIDWTDVAVNFGQIEQKIMALTEVYRYLYKYSSSYKTAHRKLFIKAYESNYELSGLRLYQAVVSAGTFQENLGDSIVKFLEYDRSATQHFMLGVVKLLVQAVEIEQAYLQIEGAADIADDSRALWEKRMQEVKSTFEKIDQSLTDGYLDQSLKDIKKYAIDNARDATSNEVFSKGLYEMLTTKFYWRDWLVVVYNPIEGSKNHFVKQCNGHILFRQNGRNIVVASVDKNAKPMDIAAAKTVIGEVARSTVLQAQDVDRSIFKTTKWSAEKVFQEIEQAIQHQPVGRCSFGAIKGGNDIHVISKENRAVVKDAQDYYKLFLFGKKEPVQAIVSGLHEGIASAAETVANALKNFKFSFDKK